MASPLHGGFLVSQIYPNALDVAVELDRVLAEFATITAHLIAAERNCRIECVVAVDPDGAGFDLAGQFVGFLNVFGPDRAGKTEGGLVGLFCNFFGRLERNNCQDWSEDFFFGNAHVVVAVGEDRRFDEVSLLQLFRTSAATCELGAFFLGDVDVVEDAFLLFFGYLRTDVGLLVHSMTLLHLRNALGELAHEFIMNRAFQEES